MIKLHKSFIFVSVIMVAAGYGGLLLLLLLSVTLHELAHVLTAKYFGGCFKGIHLSALGEAAVIDGLDHFKIHQRYATFLAGPVINIVIALLAMSVGWTDVSFYNMVLGLFNLLPVFPLDGGRVLQLFLGNRIGVLRANRFIIKMGRFIGLLLWIPGLIQLILFPLNVSLFCVGLYIRHKNNQLLVPLTFAFFKTISQKKTEELYPVQLYAACEKAALLSVVERLSWDTVLYVRVGGKEIHETEIINYVLTNGLNGTMDDMEIDGLTSKNVPV